MLGRLFASKPVRSILSAILITALLLILLNERSYFVAERADSAPKSLPTESSSGEAEKNLSNALKGRLHLLIPATRSNPELCKLLISAQVLDYPTPVLINFADEEDSEHVYKQHLAKVQGILDYLEQINTTNPTDLALIVDGYDSLFQLGPDVLIKRYYESNAAADALARGKYGDTFVDEYDVRHSIVFGPDKVCWPFEYARPACWAVPEPEESMPAFAYGPLTSTGRPRMNTPRWLNSGTIIGPVLELRELFAATLDAIQTKWETDSDQFYFANIFGEQEYFRNRHFPELLARLRSVRIGDELLAPGLEYARTEPELRSDQKTDYHIRVDYNSTMFQTLAFYKQHLTFMRPIDSWYPPKQMAASGSAMSADNRFALQLPDDVMESPPPFEALRLTTQDDSAAIWPSWADVQLLYNTATRQIPVLIHFTGEKQFREYWWQLMWFRWQGQEQRLRLASQKLSTGGLSTKAIGGFTWYKGEPDDDAEDGGLRLGGAWSDAGGWYSWSNLCRAHEMEIFAVPDEDPFHPAHGRASQ